MEGALSVAAPYKGSFRPKAVVRHRQISTQSCRWKSKETLSANLQLSATNLLKNFYIPDTLFGCNKSDATFFNMKVSR